MTHKNLIYKALLFCILLFNISCNTRLENKNRIGTRIENIPDELNCYVDSLKRDIDYYILPDFSFSPLPLFISKDEALEDAQTLKYIIETGYCGRYYWGNNGVDFDELYIKLNNFIETSADSISVKGFENNIIENFANLNDGHSKLIGFKATEFAKSKHAYFADIVLENQNNKYVVVQSNQSLIKAGMQYSDSNDRLFLTLSPENKKHYLVGILSYNNIANLVVSFEGNNYNVQLHRCRISMANNSDKVYEIDIKDSITYVRVSKFEDKYQNQLKKFTNAGKKLKNKKLIIYNLINNDGGNAIYPRLFTENLNTYAKGFDYLATLHSPAINQAYMPGKNTWMSDYIPIEWLKEDVDLKKLPQEIAQIISDIRDENARLKQTPAISWEMIEDKTPESGTYKGRFITIINSRVGSSANNATAFTKSIPNSMLIGENTSGGYTFGEVIYYNLEHSRLKLKLPIKIVIHKDFNFEQGFLPDYWLDSADPELEITKWINNPETYKFSY
jgi:hypothetical protein